MIFFPLILMAWALLLLFKTGSISIYIVGHYEININKYLTYYTTYATEMFKRSKFC